MKKTSQIIVLTYFLSIRLLVAEENAEGDTWTGLKDKVGKMAQGVGDIFAAETDRTAELIEAIEEFCPEFIEIRDKQKSAPADAFFAKDKDDYDEDAQDMLKEIRDMLFDDKMTGYSVKIKSLEKEIKLKIKEVSGIRKAIVDAKAVNNLRKVNSLEEAISRINDEDIIKLEAEIDQVKEKISDKFRKMGVSIEDSQIDQLCSRIDGDEILKAMTMIDVFKQVLERTTAYMETATGDIDTMRQYYGICVLLFEANVYAKQLYIEQVDNEWIPKLDVIESKMNAFIVDTKILLDSDDGKYAEQLQGNLLATKQGIKAVKFYKKELISQRNKVQKAQIVAAHQKDIAWNTYEAVSLGAELISMVENANAAFTKVMDIEMPELTPVDSALQESYNDLTVKLKNS
jgi:hypothetical protein